MARPRNPELSVPALRTWHTLNQHLRELTRLGFADLDEAERQAWALLEAERTGLARMEFLIRIYGSAAKFRYRREREQLLKGLE